ASCASTAWAGTWSTATSLPRAPRCRRSRARTPASSRATASARALWRACISTAPGCSTNSAPASPLRLRDRRAHLQLSSRASGRIGMGEDQAQDVADDSAEAELNTRAKRRRRSRRRRFAAWTNERTGQPFATLLLGIVLIGAPQL